MGARVASEGQPQGGPGRRVQTQGAQAHSAAASPNQATSVRSGQGRRSQVGPSGGQGSKGEEGGERQPSGRGGQAAPAPDRLPLRNRLAYMDDDAAPHGETGLAEAGQAARGDEEQGWQLVGRGGQAFPPRGQAALGAGATSAGRGVGIGVHGLLSRSGAAGAANPAYPRGHPGGRGASCVGEIEEGDPHPSQWGQPHQQGQHQRPPPQVGAQGGAEGAEVVPWARVAELAGRVLGESRAEGQGRHPPAVAMEQLGEPRERLAPSGPLGRPVALPADPAAPGAWGKRKAPGEVEQHHQRARAKVAEEGRPRREEVQRVVLGTPRQGVACEGPVGGGRASHGFGSQGTEVGLVAHQLGPWNPPPNEADAWAGLGHRSHTHQQGRPVSAWDDQRAEQGPGPDAGWDAEQWPSGYGARELGGRGWAEQRDDGPAGWRPSGCEGRAAPWEAPLGDCAGRGPLGGVWHRDAGERGRGAAGGWQQGLGRESGPWVQQPQLWEGEGGAGRAPQSRGAGADALGGAGLDGMGPGQEDVQLTVAAVHAIQGGEGGQARARQAWQLLATKEVWAVCARAPPCSDQDLEVALEAVAEGWVCAVAMCRYRAGEAADLASCHSSIAAFLPVLLRAALGPLVQQLTEGAGSAFGDYWQKKAMERLGAALEKLHERAAGQPFTAGPVKQYAAGLRGLVDGRVLLEQLTADLGAPPPGAPMSPQQRAWLGSVQLGMQASTAPRLLLSAADFGQGVLPLEVRLRRLRAVAVSIGDNVATEAAKVITKTHMQQLYGSSAGLSHSAPQLGVAATGSVSMGVAASNALGAGGAFPSDGGRFPPFGGSRNPATGLAVGQGMVLGRQQAQPPRGEGQAGRGPLGPRGQGAPPTDGALERRRSLALALEQRSGKAWLDRDVREAFKKATVDGGRNMCWAAFGGAGCIYGGPPEQGGRCNLAHVSAERAADAIAPPKAVAS